MIKLSEFVKNYPYVFYITGLVFSYLIGVYVGKRYMRRELVPLFTKILDAVKRLVLTGNDANLRAFIDAVTDSPSFSVDKQSNNLKSITGTVEGVNPSGPRSDVSKDRMPDVYE